MKLQFPTKRKYKAISAYWEDKKTSEYYKRWGWKHNGIDWAESSGSDLIAIADITCYNVMPYHPDTNKWGNSAWFTIDGKVDSGCVYGHISSFGSLKVGDKFKAGEVLPCKSGGDTKESGYPVASSGSHLHLGVWLDGFKDPLMGNYSDILGLFFDEETIEARSRVDKTINGKAWFIKDNLKKWSPDLLTFYSYGLIPEDLIVLDEYIPGNSAYWTELFTRIKDGEQLQYKGSLHQKLFDSMRKRNIIKI